MAFKNKEILFGLFDDETQLLAAVSDAKKSHMEIDNVYSPFPVHGLDPLLGLEEPRLHVAGFFYGLTGTLTAFLGMTWIFTRDWPTIFGGKPYFSFPAFVPIMFELTVLFAALASVGAFMAFCGMPRISTPPPIDKDLTCDKFAIFIPENDTGFNYERAEKLLKELGAVEIKKVMEF